MTLNQNIPACQQAQQRFLQPFPRFPGAAVVFGVHGIASHYPNTYRLFAVYFVFLSLVYWRQFQATSVVFLREADFYEKNYLARHFVQRRKSQ